MPKESDHERGYNDAANDLAIAITELRLTHHVRRHMGRERIDIIELVEKFKQLRAARFANL